MKEQPRRKRDILQTVSRCPSVPWNSSAQQSVSVLKIRNSTCSSNISPPNKIKQMVLVARKLACTTEKTLRSLVAGWSWPASLLIKSLKRDPCSAEEVRRNPALLVHWCLSKGFYNSVGTVKSSCVNYRRASNRLQQSVLAFNQLFQQKSRWNASLCVGVSDLPLCARCPPAYFCGCSISCQLQKGRVFFFFSPTCTSSQLTKMYAYPLSIIS